MGNELNSKASDEAYVGTDPIYQNHAYDTDKPLTSSDPVAVADEVRAAVYEEGAKIHTIPGIIPDDNLPAKLKLEEAGQQYPVKLSDEQVAKIEERFAPSPAEGETESAPADDDEDEDSTSTSSWSSSSGTSAGV